MLLTEKLTAIADAIRIKTGSSDLLTLEEMPDAIYSITTGSSDVPFKYGGVNAALIASYSENYTLADTSFVIGSSSSTSSTSIKATVANRFTNTTGSQTYAYGDKDIIVVQKGIAVPTHDASATKKAMQLGFAVEHVAWFSKRKTSDTSSKTTRQAYILSSQMNRYYNTSGTLTRGVVNYGFYMSPQTPSVYSATAASTYVRCGSPILYYRVSASYETAANIKLVTECDFKWTLDVYAVDSLSTITAALNDDLDSLLLTGL